MKAVDPDRSTFECAFLATSYLVERRGDDLIAPLAEPTESAVTFARALSRPEREARAVVLARELARIAQSLDARRFK